MLELLLTSGAPWSPSNPEAHQALTRPQISLFYFLLLTFWLFGIFYVTKQNIELKMIECYKVGKKNKSENESV
jgi:hypothetical protein